MEEKTFGTPGMHVTLEQAQIALAAAQKRAVEIDTRMCIAVVDSSAN
ncbi:MAG: hypothetical protein LC647_01075 [Beggiatoa sp.]|nr:hypothetical protein [Beggiatoa sp.]